MRLEPVMVTVVPPPIGPEAGDMPLTTTMSSSSGRSSGPEFVGRGDGDGVGVRDGLDDGVALDGEGVTEVDGSGR